MFERATVGLSEVDADGRFLRVDAELGRILGRAPAARVGTPVLAATHPQDHALSLDGIARVLADGGPRSLQKRYRRPDGDDVPAQSSLTRLGDPQGGPPHVLAVTVDLSAIRAAEASLRASEAKYRSLFDSIDEGFNRVRIERDADDAAVDDTVLEPSPAQRRMSGLENLVGRRIRDALPGLEPVWIERFDRVARSGLPMRFEQRFDMIDRWYDVHASRIGALGGTVLFESRPGAGKTVRVRVPLP